MKSVSLVALVLTLAGLVLAGLGSANASDSPRPDDSRTNQVFQLPADAGDGGGKQVSVLLDAPYLKLATVILRNGTALPSHRTPVPATILVLAGAGVVHIGNEALPVSRGTLVAVARNVEHDVVPKPGSEMILLVHYLRASEALPESD
jgi:quercetin dioxygenase-like cupin family protein